MRRRRTAQREVGGKGKRKRKKDSLNTHAMRTIWRLQQRNWGPKRKKDCTQAHSSNPNNSLPESKSEKPEKSCRSIMYLKIIL